MLEVIFEEKSRMFQGLIVPLRSINTEDKPIAHHLLPTEPLPGFLHLLSPLPVSLMPVEPKPQLPASALCVLFSSLKIEVATDPRKEPESLLTGQLELLCQTPPPPPLPCLLIPSCVTRDLPTESARAGPGQAVRGASAFQWRLFPTCL